MRVHQVLSGAGPVDAVTRQALAWRERFAAWGWGGRDAAVHIDPRMDGRVTPLSGSEFRLLSAFVELPQVVLSREQLLERLKGPRADLVFDRSIDTQISRLRRKLEDDGREPRLIRTARGEGYVLAADVIYA